jgi:hypothetical protein
MDGGEGDDGMYGGYGDDTLNGGTGDDSMYGGPGDDTLDGGDGDDVMKAGYGADHVDGGAGSDELWGGNEIFFFRERRILATIYCIMPVATPSVYMEPKIFYGAVILAALKNTVHAYFHDESSNRLITPAVQATATATTSWTVGRATTACTAATATTP